MSQIIHSIGSKRECVKFLCMIHSSKPLIGTQKVVSGLFKSLPVTNIKVVKSQKQRGVKDCGLLSVAFATALAHGQNVSKVRFNEITPRYLLSAGKTCSFSMICKDTAT